ncbi:hypothetical protein IFM89_004672 [Coptis chinensis]|uniref:Uncharacterized protein n=1 Tax=Coptis chinensis TaxID=261450 RepID=A0A835M3T5_9MAGN|nr:hypothetical protein IFM89_004672 [Coptis chinensis]
MADYPYVPRIRVKGPGYPPVLAYWIHGTSGESDKILSLLKAVYHPRNRYLLELDAGSSDQERRKLALSVQSDRVFRAFRNVDVVHGSNFVDRMRPSALAATLHAAALFLKLSRDWDWFITLSSTDYPLMTQDDLLHAFTFLPRDLNLIRFSKRIEEPSANKIIIDPSLSNQRNAPIFYSTEKRVKPNAFKIFHGSSWVIPTRSFMEHCINGWDNLPRTLLMYFTNAVNPLEYYFHTILCNSPHFQNTSINSNLRYLTQDNHRNMEPQFLDLSQYKNMLGSRSAFAGQFKEWDLVLKKLDEDILKRVPDGLVAGQWCLSPTKNQSTENSISMLDSCTNWGNINTVKPGPYGLRLGRFLSKISAEARSRSSQCNQQ